MKRYSKKYFDSKVEATAIIMASWAEHGTAIHKRTLAITRSRFDGSELTEIKAAVTHPKPNVIGIKAAPDSPMRRKD